jgi:transposase
MPRPRTVRPNWNAGPPSWPVSDDWWAVLAPIRRERAPPSAPGRPGVEARARRAAILLRLRSGCHCNQGLTRFPAASAGDAWPPAPRAEEWTGKGRPSTERGARPARGETPSGG